ncbi:MAG: hypothetical protein ACRCV9_17725, partial [Burkholderiaceae bacterium]
VDWRSEIASEARKSVPYGFVRGLKDIVDTGARAIASPFGYGDAVADQNKRGKAEFDKQTEGSFTAGLGRVIGNVTGALPLVAGAGAATTAAGLPRLGSAIASSGMSAGSLLPRVAGGAAAGGISAAAVDPGSAATGAAIGGAFPLLGAGLGALKNVAPKPAAVKAARDAGMTLPARDAGSGMLGSTLEAIGGKAETAQIASLRNQERALQAATKAIGAKNLDPAEIASIREAAYRSGYEPVRRAGTLQGDSQYFSELRAAAAPFKNRAFKATGNPKVEALVDDFAQPQFDATDAIDGIRRVREMADEAYAAGNKSEGKAYKAVANALEGAVSRNLNPQMLKGYQEAREMIAKTYSIENAARTGNLGRGLGAQLKKGRPLTGELRSVGSAAAEFPHLFKNIQGVNPYSRLDTAAAGASAALQSPTLLALATGKPFARNLSLNPTIQNIGLNQMPQSLQELLAMGLAQSTSQRN